MIKKNFDAAARIARKGMAFRGASRAFSVLAADAREQITSLVGPGWAYRPDKATRAALVAEVAAMIGAPRVAEATDAATRRLARRVTAGDAPERALAAWEALTDGVRQMALADIGALPALPAAK